MGCIRRARDARDDVSNQLLYYQRLLGKISLFSTGEYS